MAVNWGLSGGNNALAMFQQGLQLGDYVNQRRDQNAMLQQRQQQIDLQAQEQAAEAERKAKEQRRADLPLIGRLLDGVTPENYGQRVQVAQEYGIDTSTLPQTYDPQWVESTRQTVTLLQSPQGQEALSTAGKQAMDMGYRPGTPEFAQVTTTLVQASLAQPYTGNKGETRLYTPTIAPQGSQNGAGPAVGAIEDGHRFKGGNPADPASWEPVGGQQAQMTVTARELDALVRQFGPEEVQRRLDSGIVAVRN